MKEEIELEIKDLWNNHRKASLGLVLGVALGVFVIFFGFLNTLFVTLCAVLGLVVGKRLDNGENVFEKVEMAFRSRFKGH